jgi:hypothetical protein
MPKLVRKSKEQTNTGAAAGPIPPPPIMHDADHPEDDSIKTNNNNEISTLYVCTYIISDNIA